MKLSPAILRVITAVARVPGGLPLASIARLVRAGRVRATVDALVRAGWLVPGNEDYRRTRTTEVYRATATARAFLVARREKHDTKE